MKAKTRIRINHHTGVYRPNYRLNMAQCHRDAKRWSIFTGLCREYAALGLDYSTEINTKTMTVDVVASGNPVYPELRPATLKPWRDKGKPLTAKQCDRRMKDMQEADRCDFWRDLKGMAEQREAAA